MTATRAIDPGADANGVDLRGETALLAVSAHGLLNSASVLLGLVDTLRYGWSSVSDREREQLLAALYRHAELISGALRDLARGVPLGIHDALDDSSARGPATG